MMQRPLYCVSVTDLLWYIAVHRFGFVSSVSSGTSATSVVHIDVVFTLCVCVCMERRGGGSKSSPLALSKEE